MASLYKKYASYPDWRISLHAPTCQSPSPSQRWSVCHTWFATVWPILSHLALRLSNALSIFHFLALGPNLAEACSRCHSAIVQNFSPIAQTVYKMCVMKIFHFLVLGAWAKIHQRGDNLLPNQVYHPAKFRRHASTHARDVRYKNPADKQTAVNDISQAHLLACGIKKCINGQSQMWIVVWTFITVLRCCRCVDLTIKYCEHCNVCIFQLFISTVRHTEQSEMRGLVTFEPL